MATPDKSPHILNTSATILGICTVLITGLKFTKSSATTYLDETAMITAIIMYASCILSYLSIRSRNESNKFEQWADYIFLVGLFLLLVSMFLVAINVI